jgi:flagellar motor switch protein FliM
MKNSGQLNISLPMAVIEEIRSLAEVNQVTPSRAAAELIMAALERSCMELGLPQRRRKL